MSVTGRSLIGLMMTIFLHPANLSRAEPPRQPRRSADYQTRVREATQDLLREVERLQEDVIAELGNRPERSLYRQADDVLERVVRFQQSLTAGPSRQQLYKDFNILDLKLAALLKAVRGLTKGGHVMLRTVARVAAADGELFFVLSQGDSSIDRTRQVMERQAIALRLAAQELEETVRYVLASNPDRGALADDLHKLSQDVGRFEKSLAENASRERLQADFARVNHAWKLVNDGLKRLSPRENTFLLRRARRVDHFHARLFRLLGLKGERPQLIIRT